MLRYVLALFAITTTVVIAGCGEEVVVGPAVAPPPVAVAGPAPGLCNDVVDCKGEAPTIVGPCPDGTRRIGPGSKWTCIAQHCAPIANCE